jgi:hypothetical protein
VTHPGLIRRIQLQLVKQLQTTHGEQVRHRHLHTLHSKDRVDLGLQTRTKRHQPAAIANRLTQFPARPWRDPAFGKSAIRNRSARSAASRSSFFTRRYAAAYVWAVSALTASPRARAHYDHCGQANDRHTAAQRNLFNRMIGMLYHCLQTGQIYNEQRAFPAAA